ncbi:histone-lysine N-methyltransferase EHMT2-like [Oenanthe melanoleuca]|uniref:histone-lysine N-methyltransferase EHMT2-like n=1 Tax=Oenanthe melanoleuca TaxID=2939378 RepID=UPI0024C20863|nr:histone-lysine N-methyltransferase EHMT2-like [Oenanthe melanoleuca]
MVPLCFRVCRPQQPAPRVLERLLQDFSRQGHTLSQVCRDKAVLAQENAALQARLAAAEQELRGLSEQLAEARSEKESLQCSLLEVQQHVLELEMARSCLDGQVCSATQAKEVILEDVKGLRRELQAVRSFSKQQCENMAEQLRWAEEQCSKALRLWQCAQEEENRKLENLGTFLECHPDVCIGHWFHRSCVSRLGGLIFCPHCGEDASEAQEVTLPRSEGAPLTKPGQEQGGRHEAPTPSARMRGQGEGRAPPPDPRAEPIDSSGGLVLPLPSGGTLSARGLPPGTAWRSLEKALLGQESERRKKLRFHPRQLYLSVKQGQLGRVILMLLDNLDPNFQSDTQSKHSALHAAAQKGHLEICHLLLQAGANINAVDKQCRTPLMEAVAHDQLEAARYLLRRGGCVYSKEEDSSTCLHHAAKNGNLEMVELLLSTGQVDVNAQVSVHSVSMTPSDPQDNGGWTPIIWVAEHKHIEVIRRLLTRGADVTLTDNEENICLHWASFTGSAEIAEVLLNAQCDLHAVNFHGDTPLHIAARESYHDCVSLFLSRGADPELRNKEGDSPLDLTPERSEVWVALQLNRKLRLGAAGRALHTEGIVSRDVARGHENMPIPCVNSVDEEPCPQDYKYIAENCETSTMNIDHNITHLQHCTCQDDCSSSNCLCGQLSIRCWYDKDGRLLQEFNKIEPPPIFEYNQACTCWRSCKNRVVQSGIK